MINLTELIAAISISLVAVLIIHLVESGDE